MKTTTTKQTYSPLPYSLAIAKEIRQLRVANNRFKNLTTDNDWQIAWIIERHFAELQRSHGELVEAMKQFAECDLNDDNCASLEVASKRIRNIANKALSTATALQEKLK